MDVDEGAIFFGEWTFEAVEQVYNLCRVKRIVICLHGFLCKSAITILLDLANLSDIQPSIVLCAPLPAVNRKRTNDRLISQITSRGTRL